MNPTSLKRGQVWRILDLNTRKTPRQDLYCFFPYCTIPRFLLMEMEPPPLPNPVKSMHLPSRNAACLWRLCVLSWEVLKRNLSTFQEWSFSASRGGQRLDDLRNPPPSLLLRLPEVHWPPLPQNLLRSLGRGVAAPLLPIPTSLLEPTQEQR